MSVDTSRFRMRTVILISLAFWTVLVGKLFFIQIVKNDYYRTKARAQYEKRIEIEPKRGIIYDRNNIPLAINLSLDSFYAIPLQVEQPEELINFLIENTATGTIDSLSLWNRLANNSTAFIWLFRRVNKGLSEKFYQRNFAGVYSIAENKRFYPKGKLSASIIGFTGIDNQGLEGIEAAFESLLRGVSGWSIMERDARGEYHPTFQYAYRCPKGGFNIILTIDALL